MGLIKTSLYSAIAVLVRIITLLGINKILAIYLGPSGYAIVGNFQNTIQILVTIASGAINSGMTKYTAEYHDDNEKTFKLWRTGLTISLVCSAFVSVFIYIFSEQLARMIFFQENLSFVFQILSFSVVFYVLNTFMISIINGKKEIKKYVVVNVSGSIISIIFIYFLTTDLGLNGALISLATYQAISLIATTVVFMKSHWFKFDEVKISVDKEQLRKLSKFTLMALASAICVPMSHMMIREYILGQLGVEQAGFWEATWRLSTTYLMVVTMTLGVYYLPRLSEIKERYLLRKEIIHGYKIILPLAGLCSFCIYLLREDVIKILFSDEFSSISSLLTYQLAGDFVKIASWLMGFVLTAKAYAKAYILSEILFSFSFYMLVVIFVPIFELEGASIAHLVNYILHLLFISTYLYKKKII
ncbi:O-antigen translocase [Vibrio sp. IRLE0018]|uniref:O-antigen translocase n=1 Tax=Vibrio floridensis TaxID=2908007 RepID=UPI001F199B13|nr:O-antigen translocase [Vibrio floridensis]MCF8780301.1 O-antigen translocase [Vibrio floridensis]